MSNSFFQFKQFTIHQDRCAMKVTTDACLFGAWVAKEINNEELIIKNSLDVGTGTGLLALMLAQKNHAVNILAIEIDENAAAQAKENIDTSPWKDRIKVTTGDIKSHILPQKLDLIISNPPFYEKEIRSTANRRNVAHHSENLTLEELLIVIKGSLDTNGNFLLLLPYKRDEEIRRLFKKHKLHICKIVFVRQSSKHDYFRIMVKGKISGHENEETHFNEMSIWNEKQEYTPEFVELLKDYYLYL